MCSHVIERFFIVSRVLDPSSKLATARALSPDTAALCVLAAGDDL
ncbi:MAG TPA: hypothetical protein VFE63_12645 [Roseiarcus sp.]|nr:hypothetical protein [Roseiarcus sp.]